MVIYGVALLAFSMLLGIYLSEQGLRSSESLDRRRERNEFAIRHATALRLPRAWLGEPVKTDTGGGAELLGQ